ncbi:MAG: sec-independent protein translocase protein TatA [Crocinitomicaceae bacterium]|jgi:sec-independent protein translocase protein TatA
MLLIFNDIGGFEILLIMGFILVFFGSKSIPGLARTFGKTIRQIKEASADIKSEIKKSTDEMKGDLDLKGLISETAEDIKRPLDQYAQDIDNAVKYTPPKRTTLVAGEIVEEAKVVESESTEEDVKAPEKEPTEKDVKVSERESTDAPTTNKKPEPKSDDFPSKDDK